MLRCNQCDNEGYFEVEERTQKLLHIAITGPGHHTVLATLEDRHWEWTFVRCARCRHMMEYNQALDTYSAAHPEKED